MTVGQPQLRIRLPSGARMGWWLALVAVLVTLLVPLLTPGPEGTRGTEGLERAEGPPWSFVLCSALHPGDPAAAAGNDTAPAPGSRTLCAFCLPLIGGVALPTSLVILVEVTGVAVANPGPIAWQTPRVFPRPKPTHSRAPPVLG